MTALVNKAVMKLLTGRAEQYQPNDPYYDYTVDDRGKKQKKRRPVPPGLSKRDERILKKIRKRAHYLDKGMSICGFRVGWTFFIGIIPGAGDIVDALLNYSLVLAPAKKLELPSDLVTRMYINNALSFGMGVVPIAGDLFLAAWKANSRNANLVEAFLVIRGEEYLASLNQGQGAIPIGGVDGVPAQTLIQHFLKPNYGATHQVDPEANGATGNGGATLSNPPKLPPRK